MTGTKTLSAPAPSSGTCDPRFPALPGTRGAPLTYSAQIATAGATSSDRGLASLSLQLVFNSTGRASVSFHEIFPAAGRMTGKGSVPREGFPPSGETASYAFIIDCDRARNARAPFEVRFRHISTGQPSRFRLTAVNDVLCTNTFSATAPRGGFDTQRGSGGGTLNGAPGARLSWRFQDAGPGGANDFTELSIVDPGGRQAFLGYGAPRAFPGSNQPTGFNTALAPP